MRQGLFVGIAVLIGSIAICTSRSDAHRTISSDMPKSKEAQAVVSSAMTLAKDDLVTEAQIACSPAGLANAARNGCHATSTSCSCAERQG